MTKFERNCPKAAALIAELGLGKIHHHGGAYWVGDVQLTYGVDNRDGKALSIKGDWAAQEEIALGKLVRIKADRARQGTPENRALALVEEVKKFLADNESKFATTGFYHLKHDASGDEAVVLCGRGISRSPGISSIWLTLWDGWRTELRHRDRYGVPRDEIFMFDKDDEIVPKLENLIGMDRLALSEDVNPLNEEQEP